MGKTSSLTVRNLSPTTKARLAQRARRKGRSLEAEVRAILESAVKSEKRIRMGDALAELGRRVGLTNDDFAVLDQVRDKVPAEPMRFE